MRIEIELDSSHDSQERIDRILSALISEKPEKIIVKERKEREPTPKKKPKEKIDIKNGLFKDIQKEIAKLDRTKQNISYPTSLKKKLIKYYKKLKRINPETKKNTVAKLFDIPDSTFLSWLQGKKLGRLGGWKREITERKKPKIKKRKKKRPSTKKKEERNAKMIEWLNKNPIASWEEAGKRFNLSPARCYQIAKDSQKVRRIKRDWEKELRREDLKYKPEPKEEEKPKPKKSLAERILTFEHSRKPQSETIKAINECIAKGNLTYGKDAQKFGFDRRMLPTEDWFKFITEVGKKVNTMMGIDVTLSPNMTGVNFKTSKK